MTIFNFITGDTRAEYRSFYTGYRSWQEVRFARKIRVPDQVFQPAAFTTIRTRAHSQINPSSISTFSCTN